MKLIQTLLFIFSFSAIIAQGSIDGIITNEEGQPIEAAVISLMDGKTNVFQKFTLSNEEGTFSLQLDTSTYLIQVTQLGYKDTLSSIFTYTDYSDKPFEIKLGSDSEMLDEVQITAKKPMVQVLADKTVFNVNQNISSAGENGFDLLRKAPGVIIDNTNSIVVEGKSGVIVYIDDKPSILRGEDLVNYLKTIQANSIESIEIITQPSSRYDAEGNAGIINIRMKRDKSLGFKGSLNSGIVYGDFARFNNTLNLNYRSKKLSMYGSVSSRLGKSTSFINLFRIQNDVQYDSKSNSVYDFDDKNLRFGADYYASENSTLGLVVNASQSDNLSDRFSNTPIVPENLTNANEILEAESFTDSDVSNLYLNLNYRLNSKTNGKLFIDLDYGKYESIRTNTQPNRYVNAADGSILNENNIYMETPIAIDLYTGKVDYERSLFSGVLSAGLKHSRITTSNQFDFFNEVDDVFVLNNDRSNLFTYDERISAAYTNFNLKKDKWNIQAGLRLEQTNSEGILTSEVHSSNDQVKRSYLDFFPSGGISYQYTYSNSIALNFSSRIRRPNYQSLNPFEYNIDELSFSRGNPFLQPQYTNSIKLTHTYKYSLNTSISYSFIRDFSAQVTEAVGNNKNFLSPRNVANNKIINIGVSYPTRFAKWWNVYLSVNAYRSMFEATNENFLPVSRNTLSFYAQNSFTLPAGIRAEVSGWYSSPSIWGGTYLSESLGSLNLALQKNFFDDKLSVKIGVNDVLYTIPWRGTTQFGDLFIDGTGGSDSRQLTVNLTYNFGSQTVKELKKRRTGIEDEKNRI